MVVRAYSATEYARRARLPFPCATSTALVWLARPPARFPRGPWLGCDGLHVGQIVDRRVRLRQCAVALFLADRESFRVDELDLGHAEEAEKRTQESRLGVARRPRMQAAACGEHDHALRSEEHTSELQSLRHLVCR